MFHSLRNCYRAYQLHKLDFGEKGGVVWEIQREVAKTSLSESFYEAGPQASQQLVIGFSTGQFRWNIVLSTIVSLFQPASRTYFRNEDESDPDPDMRMVGLRVFPWMVPMVANSLIQWVLLSGLLGPWIFLVIPINFLTMPQSSVYTS